MSITLKESAAAMRVNQLSESAIELAKKLLVRSLELQTAAEKKQERELAGMIADPKAKLLAMAMADQLIRTSNAKRAAKLFRQLLGQYGIPFGFSSGDRMMLRAAAVGSHVMPGVVMSAVRRKLREQSRSVILPAEPEELSKYLAERKKIGWRVNLNLLGEAILGEAEAAERLRKTMELLSRPDVNYISIKISALFSQINLIAWDESLAAIKDRLRTLYRVALKENKFVNLDMEEYRDLALTEMAFRELLDEPEFLNFPAGIVLQAYLPDSWDVLQSLTSWAKRRAENGGATIKIRIVKGANLAMETVESALHGWAVAPYGSKAETDANYKRMVEYATRPENAAAVRTGVASHNLFDLALAVVLRKERGVEDAVDIEMLEGMVNHQARAVAEVAGTVLVYSPVVKEEDFGNALAYLIRRLDENTQSENYLRHLFDLRPGSAAWEAQKKRFVTAWEGKDEVSSEANRSALPERMVNEFSNEPDSDWTQVENRRKLSKAIADLKKPELPTLVSLDELLNTAVAAQKGWEGLRESERANVLRKCGVTVAEHRFEITALLNEEGKKAALDGDAEVSEAIDFCNYYATLAKPPASVKTAALGVVVITPPWNFPFAIPCSGVVAALVAGNAVILKPAPETADLGYLLARVLWEAGVPRDVLQFFPCTDGEEGRALITDPRVAAVVLTGAYETARMFQSWRPSLRLFAETSGKNAIVVSAAADRDLVVKDLIRSAFGHAGQKCSAASLAILEREVYDDPNFRKQLRDAAASLPVGPASDPRSVVTPLIREASGNLHRAFTQLDVGEEWLLEPRQDASDPCLWSPGIKLGVKNGSWFHTTECFGPVLGLMRVENLDHAVRIQNAVPFGLTAGFHSLDKAEITAWRDRAEAGNLYINRAITGAIVRRQPFGGWKKSSIGPGAKAGGPNYVNLFRNFKDEREYLDIEVITSYREAWETIFSVEHDPSALACESNVFRYRKCRGVILRIAQANAYLEFLAQTAASQCGVKLHISRESEESDEVFASKLGEYAKGAEFIRTLAVPSDVILKATYNSGLNWINASLSPFGDVELPRWLREQLVTETKHRYGNIGLI